MLRIASIAVVMALATPTGLREGAQTRAPAKPKEPAMKTAPETPIAEKKVELGQPTWDPAWDLLVEEALPPDLLSPNVSHTVKSFCPRFNGMGEADKRSFWAYFFQALAGAEAGLEPTKDVRHSEPEVAVKDDVTKRMVRSEGLMQLTYMDAERYGCDFDWEKDKQLEEHDPAKTILQPKNNLVCGVKILENQLIARRKPLFFRSSYWSTLRPGWPGHSVFLKQMSNVPVACGHPQARAQVKKASPDTGPTTAANQEPPSGAKAP